jgi:FixJ family two-component response regulator
MQTIDRNPNALPTPHSFLTRTPARPCNANLVCDMVYLIEGDSHLRKELSASLAAFEIKVAAFASATGYLEFTGNDTAACILANINLPDMSGLELQSRLSEKSNPPVIFISDHCDIAATVSAMKAGAIEFLTHPFDLPALIEAIRTAFAQDRKLRQRKAELAKLQERFSLLTPREREVVPLIVGGLLNKQAASVLGISEVTLQIHRSQVMRKTQAESFAELVRMAMKLRIPYWRESTSLTQSAA